MLLFVVGFVLVCIESYVMQHKIREYTSQFYAKVTDRRTTPEGVVLLTWKWNKNGKDIMMEAKAGRVHEKRCLGHMAMIYVSEKGILDTELESRYLLLIRRFGLFLMLVAVCRWAWPFVQEVDWGYLYSEAMKRLDEWLHNVA